MTGQNNHHRTDKSSFDRTAKTRQRLKDSYERIASERITERKVVRRQP
jgi:hypothetical protein